MTRKKVLVILPNGNGGAERQTVRIASYLPEDRFAVEYVVVGTGMDAVWELLPQGAKVTFLRVKRIWQGGVVKLYLLMRRFRPDVIFSSLHHLNGRSLFAARLAGVPKTVIRANLSLNKEDPVSAFYIRMNYPKASVIICQTEEMAEELQAQLGVSRDKIRLLANPVDLKVLFEKASKAISPYSSGVNYVNVARVLRQKGQDVLLRAFLKVREQVPEAKLHIVGGCDPADGDYLRSLRDFARFHALENVVFFHGYQSNPVPWVKYADCFVLPSRWEGLPNALIEAQCLGVPSVTTDCIKSMSTIVEEGVNGYIVPVDDEDAIAEAMVKVLALKKVPLTYKSASVEDFINCFE